MPAPSPLRWVFLITLLPLLFVTFRHDDPGARLRTELEKHPEIRQQVESAQSIDEFYERLFSLLPDGRIPGAFLPRTTAFHWVFAATSAVLFAVLLGLVFEKGLATPRGAGGVAAAMGTLGVLLLLGFQWLAEWTQDYVVTGGGLGALVFWAIKAIGFAYRAAVDPSTGFWPSFAGFTFGVGMCEEAVKLLPLYMAFRRGLAFDMRGAAFWGLASGIGFGISEGVHYASNYYNGICGPDIYVVRFVSCAALHAVWSATAAISLWRDNAEIVDSGGVFTWVHATMGAIIPVMFLHGLYDALLKLDYDAGALAVAVASAAWFLRVYGRAEGPEEAGPNDRLTTI